MVCQYLWVLDNVNGFCLELAHEEYPRGLAHLIQLCEGSDVGVYDFSNGEHRLFSFSQIEIRAAQDELARLVSKALTLNRTDRDQRI